MTRGSQQSAAARGRPASLPLLALLIVVCCMMMPRLPTAASATYRTRHLLQTGANATSGDSFVMVFFISKDFACSQGSGFANKIRSRLVSALPLPSNRWVFLADFLSACCPALAQRPPWARVPHTHVGGGGCARAGGSTLLTLTFERDRAGMPLKAGIRPRIMHLLPQRRLCLPHCRFPTIEDRECSWRPAVKSGRDYRLQFRLSFPGALSSGQRSALLDASGIDAMLSSLLTPVSGAVLNVTAQALAPLTNDGGLGTDAPVTSGGSTPAPGSAVPVTNAPGEPEPTSCLVANGACRSLGVGRWTCVQHECLACVAPTCRWPLLDR